jgi:hypothetical protein
MTIERAQRALAGLFVVVSLALGYRVHSAFFLFTAYACPAMAIFRRLGLRDCRPAAARARE